MAVFYAVEFPNEDEKSRGPYVVPQQKVKVEDESFQVLWSVVDERTGDLKEEYFDATLLKEGTKKECGDFIDHLKKSREVAAISNRGGVRSRKKPSKLDDYDESSEIQGPTGKPPAKKAKKPLQSLFEINYRDPEEIELLESEPFDPEMEGNAVLNRWKKKAISTNEKPNGHSRQNSKTESKTKKPALKGNTSSLQKRKTPEVKKSEKEAEGNDSKSALKKARSNTADLQSSNIGKALHLEMKLTLQAWDKSDTPAEFTITVAPDTTFQGLKKKIAQTTRIAPNSQLLIVKGKEWEMEEQARVCDVWSTDDMVALFEKDVHSEKFSSERTRVFTPAEDDENTFISCNVEVDGPSNETQKEIRQTTDDLNILKPTMDQLIQQVSSLAYQIQQLKSVVSNFSNCKDCLKKQYKSARAGAIPEDLQLQDNCNAAVAMKTPPPAQATPPHHSTTPEQPNNRVNTAKLMTSSQPKQNDSAAQETTLIGSPSRGLYVLKQKMELLPKSSTPKLFALKLFELVFNREEAKGGSVEGKGGQLKQLDPNRVAAIKEHTERKFASENFQWVDIKRGIDEKCRMVRNNRCLGWGGVNFKKE